MTTAQSNLGAIRIDLDEMRELVNVAIRRVSAFIRFGSDGLEDRDGGDFNLSASVMYRFWPEEVAKEDRDSAREEYRAWLLGSCLRELGLFYGLFLDKIWYAIEVSELHGTTVKADHLFDKKFSSDTNIAKKQRKVASKLGVEDQFENLNSLSFARNALTHHSGLVRSPLDCNNASRDVLTIKWFAFEMVASRGGEERTVLEAPFDTHTLPGDGPIEIGLMVTIREVSVPAGTPIRLSHGQVAELCMFYKILCDKVIDGYLSLLKEKGILVSPPQAP